MSFLVRQEGFEGPLDLLLSFIEKRKLHISDISLAKVTDDYIEHLKRMGNFPLGDSANFILIASTLLLIKSKSLLPTLALTEEEQGSVEDLERRLKIYKEVKELCLHIKERFGKEVMFMPQGRKFDPLFSPDSSMTAANLLSAIKNVISSLPKKEALPKAVVRRVISLEETIVNLTERIRGSLRMSFREFAGHHSSPEQRVNIIVSFLAMLELVKQGVINAIQEEKFDDIHMETERVGTPRYM